MTSVSNNALPDIHEIWVYLSGSPLLALILTLSAYHLSYSLYLKANRNPFVNPTAISVLIVAMIITVIDMPYAQYFSGAQFVHFLLGTATVSLAIPIYHGIDKLKARWLSLTVALLCGGLTSIVSAVVIGKLANLPSVMVDALYAKSVTAPIGMGIAERIGASPTLTAVYALITGVIGAAIGRYLLDWFACKEWWQRGFAIGTGAHGLGTTRAFSVSAEAGSFSSLAMGMHGIAGALLIPWVKQWF